MPVLPSGQPGRRTFQLELLRSLPAGCFETLVLTFSVLLAVRVFEAASWQKALLIASSSVGLLLSLFLVQVIRRTGWSLNATAAGIWIVSGCVLAMAALPGGGVVRYLAGVSVALMGMMLANPLLSQIYQRHYPDATRGRLFAVTALSRKVAALVFAAAFGWFLRKSLDGYVWLLAVYAAACLAMAAAVLGMDRVNLTKVARVKLFAAFEHVGRDREFRKLLASWMLLGIGNLFCFSLFVEFIANPRYGYQLDEFRIGFITGSVPEIMVVLCVVGWGHVFDRLNFYVVRGAINTFFASGLAIYFLCDGVWALVAGIALHGMARAGGHVAWSLWVTKFAKPDHVAEYMSVHTFLTGVRGVLAPFLAFYAAQSEHLGPRAVALTSVTLIAIATAMIAPSMRLRPPRRPARLVEPDPR